MDGFGLALLGFLRLRLSADRQAQGKLLAQGANAKKPHLRAAFWSRSAPPLGLEPRTL